MSTEQNQSSSAVFRKRGRPAGRNRVPLSMEERRARNNEYERLRRVEMRDALAELAAATGLSDDLTVQDLLAEVVMFIQTSTSRDDAWGADRLRRCNDNLASQITMLEDRLATEPDPRTTDSVLPQQPLPSPKPVKRKVEDCGWPSPPSKRLSPDQGLQNEPDFSCFSKQEYYDAQLQPWLPSEFQYRPAPEWVTQSHSSWHHQETFPLTSHNCVSPASHAIAASSDITFSPVPSTSESCSGSTHTKMEDENLAIVWAEAMDAACGSQLTLDQMDPWLTEEELVSLYF